MTLEARDVSAGYRLAPVLHDVACRIERGRLAALVGPNGSGKSTLLRCLARALPPGRGSVLLDGENLYALSPRRAAARLAYVPQDHPVGFAFTPGELAALGAEANPREGSAERTRQALGDLDLEPLAGRSLLTLSGGERQRAFAARALAQDADFLLFDEPTAHLDLRHQQQLLQRLRRAARDENRAVLLVLHDLNLAARWADDVLLLREGRIVAAGEPIAVLTPERLRAVYQTSVYIPKIPVGGRPWILTLPALPEENDPAGMGPVHVLCGGGTGAPILAALREAGVATTAGILSPHDPDAEAARALGIAYTPVAPFSPVGEAELRVDTPYLQAARHVIVAPFPVGPGNVALLRAAAERAGSILLLADPGEDVRARDHTPDGEGARLWRALEAGAQVAHGIDEIVALAGRL